MEDLEIKLTENQKKVIGDKYLGRGESPEQWLRGVAHNISLAELLYDSRIDTGEIFKGVSYAKKDGMTLMHDGLSTYKQRQINFDKFMTNLNELYENNETARNIVSSYEENFYGLLSNFEFLPNSPTLMNAGKPLQQLSACFVLPVEDNMESIFESVKNTALIHKSGGGTGFSFSRLRPKGDRVKGTGGIASGPLSFMEVFNTATETIKQGGKRRGANMGILRVDHPDIREFIKVKEKQGELENFNLSVALTGKYMNAYENGENYSLINPKTGEIEREENAREIFDLIVKNAHAHGDPGIIFIDTMNASNPTPHIGKYESTNPCGEQVLLSNESCNLGSISLPRFVEKGVVNYEGLEKCVTSAVRFLDNVIDMSNSPLPEIEASTKGNRKIGLGIMGVAEILIGSELEYNSKEAIEKVGGIMKFINNCALKSSEELAKKRGVFPNWEGSIYDPNSEHYKGKEMKVRNATRTTIAPTGTIAIAAGLQGSGIEPFFSLAYTRYNAEGLDALKRKEKPDEKDVFYEFNTLFGEIAEENNWFGFKDKKTLWEKITENHSSISNIEEIPENIRKLFVTAHDISPEFHIGMQAGVQKYTENAVSKTINLKKGTSVEEVRDAYLLAYKKKLKGVTIYVDGSREIQVLSTPGKSSEGLEKKAQIVQENVKSSSILDIKPQAIKYRVRRPSISKDSLHIILTSDLYVNDENKKAYFIPSEIFQERAPIGKAKSVSFQQAGIDRTEILRGPDPDYAEIIGRWQSPFSDENEGIGPNRINSIEHAVGVVFEDYLLRNGIVGHGEFNGLKNLVRKSELRKVEPETEEYKSLISQVRVGDNKEEIKVGGNHGKLGERFLCDRCGGEQPMFSDGCNKPKCAKCGYDNGESCG